ncbi:MAG: ATP-binding cassette domain-containing protein [Catenulispora sp.]|nr:ATP-binding cassette domain-containing protein [Catenulispora sp.]
MLTLDALRVRYGPLEALHGVSLTIEPGEVTAVVGRNGAGKSTLLRSVAGYLRPSSGRIVWQGSDITRASIGRRAAAGVLLIPDEGGVFRSLTVRENLELFAGHRAADLKLAFETFPALKELTSRRAALLSGGEQQMLALSRALLAPWRLLLVDELSQGLASALAGRLYAVLAELAAAHPDRSVVLAEPHPRAALAAVSQVHVLRRGELAASGSPADFDAATL